MNRATLKRRALPLALTGLTATPIAAAWTATPTSAATSKAHTYRGPTEYVDHGPVQVSIKVKNKRIASVSVSTSPNDARSVFIQGQAIPLLKQETLKAQSASVDLISGATQTSEGYIASLRSAISKAKKVKALR